MAIVVGPDGATRQLALPENITHLQALLGEGDDFASGAQAGCPVRILSASFERPAQLILTDGAMRDSAPSLRLGYGNFSGKEIESVVLTGWLKVKDSPYQLDSVTHPFHLELSRRALPALDVDRAEVIKLANNVVGMDRIELSQVMFADGSMWKPARRNCEYRANVGSLRVAR
jgi:hypothetical protein